MNSLLPILLILLLSLLAPAAGAQTAANDGDDVNWEVVHKIAALKISLCNNDTAATIQQLEEIERSYPTDAHVFFTDKVLGDLYLARGETGKALHCLLYALDYKPHNRYYIRKDSTLCDKAFNSFSPSQSGADICVSVSKVYIIKKKPDSSLYYLQLADDKYLPYRECVNGLVMYKSYLSPFIADAYLANGDTAKAINRLLDFFNLSDGDTRSVTAKLKTVLLYKYTQKQIVREVEKGLANLKIVPGKKDQPKKILEFTLFDHTLLLNAKDATLDKWKQTLANQENMQQLITPGQFHATQAGK